MYNNLRQIAIKILQMHIFVYKYTIYKSSKVNIFLQNEQRIDIGDTEFFRFSLKFFC